MASMTCKQLLKRVLLITHGGAGWHGTDAVGHLTRHAVTVTDWMSPAKYDIIIIGGGIVGMATARQLLLNHQYLKIAVVEKENRLAAHQSGHNSGVVHAGIYYTPGSLKAKLCVGSLMKSYDYFDANNIPYKRCGKLIVATTLNEVRLLDGLYQRGLENEVPGLSLVSEQEIQEIEPYCKGLRAIHSTYTGIVDWAEVTRSYGRNFTKMGGTIYTNFKVVDLKECEKDSGYPITIQGTGGNSLRAKYLIACGGLYSDKLAMLSGCESNPKIIPFRGEYLLLKREKEYLVRGNIYPVPDPRFPFLGVHFTPRMDGQIWLGPNAILASRREGYKMLQLSPKELAESLAFSGLQKLMLRHLPYVFKELYRGVFTGAQVKQLQRFVPTLERKDVERGPSGVRAQAMNEDGSLVDDFIIESGKDNLGKRMLHVRNAPSPAASSSLGIGEMIAAKAAVAFSLKA